MNKYYLPRWMVPRRNKTGEYQLDAPVFMLRCWTHFFGFAWEISARGASEWVDCWGHPKSHQAQEIQRSTRWRGELISHPKTRCANRPQRRHGAVLICVLACSLTALSLSILAVRTTLRSARESKQALKLRQAEWLLNAGLLRAKQKLQVAHYTGETWEIPATVTRTDAAVIRIRVEPVQSESDLQSNTVSITVESGLSPKSLQRSCKLTIQSPKHPSSNGANDASVL